MVGGSRFVPEPKESPPPKSERRPQEGGPRRPGLGRGLRHLRARGLLPLRTLRHGACGAQRQRDALLDAGWTMTVGAHRAQASEPRRRGFRGQPGGSIGSIGSIGQDPSAPPPLLSGGVTAIKKSSLVVSVPIDNHSRGSLLPRQKVMRAVHGNKEGNRRRRGERMGLRRESEPQNKLTPNSTNNLSWSLW